MEQASRLLGAIRSGNLSEINVLLESDPDLVNIRTENGVSVILLAAYYRTPDILVTLLRKKGKLDIYEAAAVGDKKMLNRNLNEEPGLINSFSADGFSPLGLASYFNQGEIVELLLSKGARLNVASRNDVRLTPLHGAVSAGSVDIARLLLQHGANVNAVQVAGYTPLHQAAYNGQMEMVELLLAFGAEANARLDSGQTPLDIALDKGHDQIAKLIEAKGGRRS